MTDHNPNASGPGPVESLTGFMLARARDVGVSETQILQLLGYRSGVGPLETLLSGRPASQTMPEIAAGIAEGTGEVFKMAKATAEAAVPIMVVDNLKPLVRKMGILDPEGVKHLEVYLNFLISQGFVKP